MPIIKVSLSTPHMLSFENKRSLFKAEVKRLKGKHKYEPILLEIRREDVFVQSFDEIMNRKPE